MYQNSWEKTQQKKRMMQRIKLEKNGQRFIWVGARENAGGEGTYGNPYDSVSKAMEYAHPGQIIVLQDGLYHGDVTIQKSGTIDKPIRIITDEGAQVQFIASCWFFYDVSDVICSGIVFKDSPGMAVSVVGKCTRNRFEFLRFINCSMEKESACTFFFGGSGLACNTVESCSFERTPEVRTLARPRGLASVGLMITEGDFQLGDPNRNHIISKNLFSRYNYGVIVGSQDSTLEQYGHQVVYNTFDNCTSEGILVKCGDTLVKGNVVRNCSGHSISIAAGIGSSIEDNRIIDCDYGIRVSGVGHSVSNNCIIRCREASIGIFSSMSPETVNTSNILIERNTFVGDGNGDRKNIFGIQIEQMTTCIIRKNLFHNMAIPYKATGSIAANDHENAEAPGIDEKRCMISDNIVSGIDAPLNGCSPAKVAFKSAAFDNYMNESGYGAGGWLLSPEAFDPGPELFADEFDADKAMDRCVEEEESLKPRQRAEEEDVSLDVPDEFAVKSMFFNTETEDEEEASALSAQDPEDLSDDDDE
jgi:hypothetical protein